MRQVNIYLDDGDYKRLRSAAFESETKMVEVVRMALREFLDAYERCETPLKKKASE